MGYKSKPTEFGIINNRLISCEAECVTWSDFCDLVGNKGHAFLTSDFHNSKRNKENFKSQQIFALDFDVTVSFNEASQIAERYGIPIALAYETYSSVNCDRFRIVFISNSPVYDIRVAEVITDALTHIFEGSDTACRDVSRIFLGGKSVIFENEARFSVLKLLMELGRFMKAKFKDNHYKKHLEIFYKRRNLKCRNSFAVLSNIECDDFYEFNDINGIIYFNFDYKENKTNITTDILNQVNKILKEKYMKLADDVSKDSLDIKHQLDLLLLKPFVKLHNDDIKKLKNEL